MSAIMVCRLCMTALLLLMLALMSTITRAAENDAAFAEALTQLATNNFKAKEQAATALVTIRHTGTRRALQALLDGQLYYRRDDKRVFIANERDDGLALTDPVTSLP